VVHVYKWFEDSLFGILTSSKWALSITIDRILNFRKICMFAFILSLSLSVLPGEAQFQLADSQVQASKYADAMETYQAIVDTDPALAPYAKIRAATTRALAGDTTGAINELKIIINAHQTGPWVRYAEYELAQMLHKEKRYLEASAHYALAINAEVDLWWMDDIRWAAAENQLEIPDQKNQSLNFFRNMVETTRWYYKRLNAARILKDSDRAEDRIKSALGLLRCRKFDEAKEVAASIPKTWLTEPHLTRQWEHLSARILIARGMRTEGNNKLKALAEDYPEDTWADTALLYSVISLLSDEQFSEAEHVNAQLIRMYPESTKTADSILRMARAYAKFKKTDEAIKWYRQHIKLFPNDWESPVILLEAGHVYRKAGRDQEAIGMFEQLSTNYPNSSRVADAAFWAGQLLEKNKQKKLAKQQYELSAEKGLTHYYGFRAQEFLVTRFGLSKSKAPPLHITPEASFVRAIPQFKPDPGFALKDLAESDRRFARLKFFAHNGSPEAEWESLYLTESIANHAKPELMYRGIGEGGTAYSAMQWASEKNFEVDDNGVQSVKRLRIRYPRPYWEYVKSLSEEFDVDPYLILSIARQESTYRPALTSHAGASGVMQLMPRTAKWLADVDSNISQENASNLEMPQHSLRMGTVYIKRMLDRSDGNVIYALASYNAGPGNCDKWRKRNPNQSMEEFVENIPFSETQHYVKNILSHYATYKSIYLK